MKDKTIQILQWEEINKDKKKRGILKTVSADTNKWEVADFTEFLSQLEVKQNNLNKGFSSLWSESKFTNAEIINILNNYREMGKRYSKVGNLLVNELAHTNLRTKLDNVSANIYQQLKKQGISLEKLEVIKPFLKTRKEVLVEEKHRDQLLFKYGMNAFDLEVEVKRLSNLVASEYKELQSKIARRENSKRVITASYLNSYRRVWDDLTADNVSEKEIEKTEKSIRGLEEVLVQKRNQLANIYRNKQQFILQALVEVK